MSKEGSSKPEASSSATGWIIWVLAGLIAYALSPGAFVVAIERWGWPMPKSLEKPFAIFYAPLAQVLQWGPGRTFYQWYFELCAGHGNFQIGPP